MKDEIILGGLIALIMGGALVAVWIDKAAWVPAAGDTVVFQGAPVVFLGSAGRDTATYLVRFPDGTEKHALFKELAPIKEKP